MPDPITMAQPSNDMNPVSDVPAMPQVANAPDGPVPASTAAGSAPEIADDGDLIEKEWVVQAKQIMKQTAGDPFQQNAQFTKLKLDYLQKRYGKQLKTGD